MKSYFFTVSGKPEGKRRPRFSRKTGTAYNPQENIAYENRIENAFRVQYPTENPTDKPVSLNVIAVYPIPKSWAKKKQIAAHEGEIFPSRPDWDNIGKIVCDALNGVAFHDDAQIYNAFVRKQYGLFPELRVLIEITDGEEKKTA